VANHGQRHHRLRHGLVLYPRRLPAIIALMFAKHILVAILVMGLGVDAPSEMPL